MRQQVENGICYFQFDNLLGTANGRIQHAVFGRQGGVSPTPFASLNLSVSVPDEKAYVYANRRRAFDLFGRDTGNLVHAHLVHGRAVARVTSAGNGTWIEHVDGIITNEPGCGLTMNFADCTPILLYDPVRQAIGLGHAGWQGCMADLPGAMVQAMQAEFGSQPEHLWAGIGPCIGLCCYEVDEPVISAVHEAFARPEWFLLPQPGRERPHFDLPQANRRNLLRAGILPDQIEMSGLCTACRTDLFFSHRAENGRTGRFGSIFLLTDK
jgi:polyphenol oxidase